MLTAEQFERTRRLALELAGIELIDRHREVLARRSRRAGLEDRLDALLGAVEKGETRATQRLLCLLTTKFTGFFRHPRHFEIVAEHALRAVQQRGQARLWSAGAATGEEPYSLVMALIRVFHQDDPPATVLATDVDTDAIAVAKAGEYGELTLRSLDPALRERFFCQADVPNRWKIIPAARRFIDFQELNLIAPTWPAKGPFDVIFCRNVLMYLETNRRSSVLERIVSLLAPEGLLILDPAEYLGKAAALFTPVSGGVYSPARSRFALGNNSI